MNNKTIKIDELFNREIKITGLPEYDRNKHYVCFGAGTATELFFDFVPKEYKIEYIVDNDEKKWGSIFCDHEVISPSRLVEIEDVCILVLNRHVKNISIQLNELGYKENIDYYNVYEPNEPFFITEKMNYASKGFLSFIDSLPPKEKWKKKSENEQHIGIVINSAIRLLAQFQLEIYLLLRIQGYNVKLIIDTTGEFVDYRYFQGSNIFFKKYIEKLLDIIEDKLLIHDWVFVEEQTNYLLSEEDKRNIEQNNHDTMISYKAYIDSTSVGKHTELSVVKDVVEKENKMHYKSLCTFFYYNKFDTILVFNGTVDKNWNYSLVGHKYGIRVPSFDTWFWSTDYPCCWLYDYKKLVDILPKEETKELTNMGFALFKDRMLNNSGDEGYKQLIAYETSEVNEKATFDILIPLNVMFDSAVLGLDKAFDSPEQWFYETVKFIYNETDAKVVIKESPVGSKLSTESFESYDKYIKEFIDGDRIVYYDRKSQINIYNLIERCKFMLPFSSTIALEGAMLNKTSIVHTSCFYSKERFVHGVETKDEYFEKIKELLNTKIIQVEDKERAALYFAFARSGRTRNMTKFNEQGIDWISYTYEDLINMKEVRAMIDVVAENKPWYVR